MTQIKFGSKLDDPQLSFGLVTYFLLIALQLSTILSVIFLLKYG
jgi:hypothetical protein